MARRASPIDCYIIPPAIIQVINGTGGRGDGHGLGIIGDIGGVKRN